VITVGSSAYFCIARASTRTAEAHLASLKRVFIPQPPIISQTALLASLAWEHSCCIKEPSASDSPLFFSSSPAWEP
jgi:hypothetical protein